MKEESTERRPIKRPRPLGAERNLFNLISFGSGKFLIAICTLLGILSGLAYLWRSKENSYGKIPIVWASDSNPVRYAQVEAFNRENPDLNLRLDDGNNPRQKIMLQSISGIGPDLIDFAGYEQEDYAASGILWDVTALAENMGFSVRKEGWPEAVDAGLYFGRQYGYYCNLGTVILIYNKNVFDFFGVPYPEELITWDAFLKIAARVNSPPFEARSIKRIYALAGYDMQWEFYFESLRGEFFTKKGLLDLKSPELRAAFQWHKDLLYKHALMPSAAEVRSMRGHGGWAAGGINQFASGRFAMMFAGDWTLVALTQAYQYQLEHQGEADSGVPFGRPLRLGAALIPHFAGMEPTCKIIPRMCGINVRSPRRKEALRVLRYFAEPTYSKLINQGMDFLPGNPQYADLGVEEKYPDLSRLQMHELTKKAMSYGYVQRRSPFFLTSDVAVVLRKQIHRMESDSSFSVDELLTMAETELVAEMQRKLARSPALYKLYGECAGRPEANQLDATELAK